MQAAVAIRPNLRAKAPSSNHLPARSSNQTKTNIEEGLPIRSSSNICNRHKAITAQAQVITQPTIRTITMELTVAACTMARLQLKPIINIKCTSSIMVDSKATHSSTVPHSSTTLVAYLNSSLKTTSGRHQEPSNILSNSRLLERGVPQQLDSRTNRELHSSRQRLRQTSRKMAPQRRRHLSNNRGSHAGSNPCKRPKSTNSWRCTCRGSMRRGGARRSKAWLRGSRIKEA